MIAEVFRPGREHCLVVLMTELPDLDLLAVDDARRCAALHEREGALRVAQAQALQRVQVEADQKLAEQNLLISKQQGADAAFNSAIHAEGAISHTGLPWWVGSIRTLFRPWLTAYLWISITIIAIVQMIWFQNGTLPSAAENIISSMNAGATAALGFWFGQRLIGSSPNR